MHGLICSNESGPMQDNWKYQEHQLHCKHRPLFQNTPAADKIEQWDIRTWTSFLLIHMHIHVAASQNVSSHLEDKCCKASDTQDICSTTALYSPPSFESVPFTLQKLFLISIPTDTFLDYFTSGVIPKALDGTIEICWTPPFPFCPNTRASTAMNGVISQVKNYNANMYCV